MAAQIRAITSPGGAAISSALIALEAIAPLELADIPIRPDSDGLRGARVRIRAR
jgi:hypothetical protein